MELQEDVIPSPPPPLPPCASSWDSLHEDMLGLILHDKVLSNSLRDYIRCATVCKSWFHSCAQYSKKKQKQLPLLLLPPTGGDEIYPSLYSIISNTRSCRNLTVPAYCNRYCGSSHGWLIFQGEYTTLALTLFNPFTGTTMHLPPLHMRTLNDIQKVVLSDDPSSNTDNYEVLCLQFGRRLALYTSRGGRWIYDDYSYDLGNRCVDADIIYFKGKFHALIGGKLGSIDIYNIDDEDDKPDDTYIRFKPLKGVDDIEYIREWAPIWLVESISGTLFCIQRIQRSGFSPGVYYPFRVYELEEEEADQGIRKFIPLLHGGEEERGIGDQALFLDNNNSASVRASDFPGCKPNSIYFTRYVDEPYEVDIYTLGDEHGCKSLYMLERTQIHSPPPVWVEPRLNLKLSDEMRFFYFIK